MRMPRMLKMCLNWKVLAGLGAAGVGIYALAPEMAAEALPLLVLALCPLSMMLMMWGMQNTQDEKGGQDASENAEEPDREEQISRLRDQRETISARITELEGDRSSENL